MIGSSQKKKKKINWVPSKTVDFLQVQKLIQQSIDENRVTNGGPNTEYLEKKTQQLLKIEESKAVVAVSNGSVAIQAVAKAIEYYHKTPIRWATQSFTFPPSTQGILSDTMIVDIDEEGGLNLDLLDKDINGIIVTNIFGNVVNISKYEKWAQEKNRFLIFDNAATPYTFYNKKSCCNYGDACTISFHHTKPLGFGEGGAIIVDKKYEQTVRCLSNFGIGLSEQYYLKEGNNYKMSDIAAVYIIQYLENFQNIVSTHQELYHYFKQKINLNKNVTLFPSFHSGGDILPSCFCLLFDNPDRSLKAKQKLLSNNIFCRKYYHPLKKTKQAIWIFEHILCLPCTKDMDCRDIDEIVSLIS